MGIISPTSIDVGGARGTEEVDVRSNIVALLSLVNGGLDDANVAAGANINGSKLLANSIPMTKLQNVKFGSYVPGVGFGSANRVLLNVPHGLGSTPSFWIAMGGYVAAASTSTGQSEAVIINRVGEDATNLQTLAVLTNGATAAVGPTRINWLAIV